VGVAPEIWLWVMVNVGVTLPRVPAAPDVPAEPSPTPPAGPLSPTLEPTPAWLKKGSEKPTGQVASPGALSKLRCYSWDC
jgi:hypothetical protein